MHKPWRNSLKQQTPRVWKQGGFNCFSQKEKLSIRPSYLTSLAYQTQTVIPWTNKNSKNKKQKTKHATWPETRRRSQIALDWLINPACLLWLLGHCWTRQNSAKQAQASTIKLPEAYINRPKISGDKTLLMLAKLPLLAGGKKADDGLQSPEFNMTLKSNLGQFYLSFERSRP